MDKTAAIQAAIASQNARAAAVTNWTTETRAKFDALMTKMVAALEAQPEEWFAPIIRANEGYAANNKAVGNAVIRAIAPLVA